MGVFRADFPAQVSPGRPTYNGYRGIIDAGFNRRTWQSGTTDDGSSSRRTDRKEIHSRLTSLSKEMKLHGFRPGKVPLKMVRRMYGTKVRQEVQEELIKSSFETALIQENLRPISGPKIDPKVVAAGQDMEYSATFEIFPNFDPQGIEGLEIERPVVEITEANIDTMLEILRTQHTTWNETDRPAQLGDRVTITFNGTIDGEDFPGNKGEEVPLVLGEGYMFKDFEDALIGLSVGAEKPSPSRFRRISGAGR